MVSQSYLCALAICAFLNSAAASVDTCDANNPKTCTSSAATEGETGSVLLQAVQTKARVKEVQEESSAPQEENLDERFGEYEARAQALTQRLHVTLEDHKKGEDVLDADHEQQVHHALTMLQQATEAISKARGDKSSAVLLSQSMNNFTDIANNAEAVLLDVHNEDLKDGEEEDLKDGEEEDDEEDDGEGSEEDDQALIQEAEEEEDEEEDEHEEEEEHEDAEEEDEEDVEEEEEHDEDGRRHDDSLGPWGDHDDMHGHDEDIQRH